MSVIVEDSLIGKTVCHFEVSAATGKLLCKSAKVTGYMVTKGFETIEKTVRLDNGQWVGANGLFYPNEREAAERRLIEKEK